MNFYTYGLTKDITCYNGILEDLESAKIEGELLAKSGGVKTYYVFKLRKYNISEFISLDSILETIGDEVYSEIEESDQYIEDLNNMEKDNYEVYNKLQNDIHKLLDTFADKNNYQPNSFEIMKTYEYTSIEINFNEK